MTAPMLFHTRVGHVRRAPIRYAFEHLGYSWFVDIDDLPRLPWWLRPLTRVDPADHFDDPRSDTSLRERLDTYLARQGVDLGGGRVTALLGARVLGYVFDPLTLFWCHDRAGALVCVVAEVHNTYGDRHCYLLRPDGSGHARADKALYVSPFNPVDGYYTLRVAEPDTLLDVEVALHRDQQPPFTATMRGAGKPVTPGTVLHALLRHPLAPQLVSARIRRHGITLWLRGLPVVTRPTTPSCTRTLQETTR